MQGGSDFSVALLVRRGSSTPLIVYATGLTSEADNGTRKALKAAAMLFFRSLPVAPSVQGAVQRDPSTGLVWGGASAVGGMIVEQHALDSSLGCPPAPHRRPYMGTAQGKSGPTDPTGRSPLYARNPLDTLS